VEDVHDVGGGAPVLVVRGRGPELLIPLAEDFVRSVDLERGLLVTVKPELVDV
jgi:ribosomal 30S subunit maturation factor RimM